MINGGGSGSEGGRINAVSSADNVLNGRTINATLIQQMKGGSNAVSTMKLCIRLLRMRLALRAWFESTSGMH